MSTVAARNVRVFFGGREVVGTNAVEVHFDRQPLAESEPAQVRHRAPWCWRPGCTRTCIFVVGNNVRHPRLEEVLTRRGALHHWTRGRR